MNMTYVFVVSAVIWWLVKLATDITYKDFGWNIPTGWWYLVAWVLGAIVAALTCNVAALAQLAGVAKGPGCVDQLLLAFGFGALSALLHALASALPNNKPLGTPSEPAPKGLAPKTLGEGGESA